MFTRPETDPAVLTLLREITRAQAMLDRHGHGYAVVVLEIETERPAVAAQIHTALVGEVRSTDLWLPIGPHRLAGLLPMADATGARAVIGRLKAWIEAMPLGRPQVRGACAVGRPRTPAEALWRDLLDALLPLATVG